uniref:Homeobox domain-containing protein n=1 Tax=Strongyloides venezuelensis TaxID=75913 RepID=A0A0K0FNF4_STRVS
MECISVNLIIEPILGNHYPPNATVFRENIQMTVTINSSTMIKDVCSVLLHRVGLGHLVQTSEAFIKCPRNNCFTSLFCLSNPMLSVGTLETSNCEYLTIKISVKGHVQDFSGLEGRNSIYRNLLHLILKKYPFIGNSETNLVVKDIINRIENYSILFLKHTSILSINDTLERELYFASRNEQQVYAPLHLLNNNYSVDNSPSIGSIDSNIENNLEPGITSAPSIQSLTTPVTLEFEDISSPVHISIDEIPTDVNFNKERLPMASTSKILSKHTPKKHTRIKFDSKIEKPVLEEWFKTVKIPTNDQLQEFAYHLNKISNRPSENKITIHNVRNWFSYRRVKEKRTSFTQE